MIARAGQDTVENTGAFTLLVDTGRAETSRWRGGPGPGGAGGENLTKAPTCAVIARKKMQILSVRENDD